MTPRTFAPALPDDDRERQAAALETAAALVRYLSAVPGAVGAVGTVVVTESGAVTLTLRDTGTWTLNAFLVIADVLDATGQHYGHGRTVCLELASDHVTWRGVPVDVRAVLVHPDTIARARVLTAERDR